MRTGVQCNVRVEGGTAQLILQRQCAAKSMEARNLRLHEDAAQRL